LMAETIMYTDTMMVFEGVWGSLFWLIYKSFVEEEKFVIAFGITLSFNLFLAERPINVVIKRTYLSNMQIFVQ